METEAKIQTAVGFPLKIFPEEIRNLIHIFAECKSVHEDYVAAAALIAFATAIGKKIELISEFSNYPSIFLAMVGDSGIGKSTPARWFLKPLREIDIEENTNYRRRVKEAIKAGDDPDEIPLRRRVLVDLTMEALAKILCYGKE